MPKFLDTPNLRTPEQRIASLENQLASARSEFQSVHLKLQRAKLDLLDRFAMAALPAVVANLIDVGDLTELGTDLQSGAALAYSMARAMLDERDRVFKRMTGDWK